MNYNSGAKGGQEFVFGPNNFCVDLKATAGKTSSVRYAGSPNDYRADTLTFYEGTYFQGYEEYTFQDLSQLQRGPSSLIITGLSPWTVYDQNNFNGESVCIYPPKSDNFTPAFVTDLKTIGIPYNTIHSARKGCWGVPKRSSGRMMSEAQTFFYSSSSSGSDFGFGNIKEYPTVA